MSGDTKMSVEISTERRINDLQKDIDEASNMPMFKQPAAIKKCVLSSVDIIKRQQITINQNEKKLSVLIDRVASLESALDNHRKTGK